MKNSPKYVSNPSNASTPFEERKDIMSKRIIRKVSSRIPAKRTGGGALVKRDTAQMQLARSGVDRARILERAHPLMVGGMPYGLLTERLTAENGELCDLAAPAALTFIEEMRPKDGLERLALSQALSAHARACWLTELMTRQTDAVGLSAISEASERAANTLARLMRAFREYREPKGAMVSIKEVGQANWGDGQLVQNLLKQEVSGKNNRDEQTRISSAGPAVEPKALLTVGQGLAVTPAQHPANPALAEKHGPTVSRGKGPRRKQCAKARRQKRRDHRTAKTDDGNN
jgi:hypothetical protein